MATGMKIWLTAVVAAIAIVAVWQLPPEPYAIREATAIPGEKLRADAIEEEFRVTGEVLRRTLWSDSLAPLAVASAREGVAFLYPASDDNNPVHLEAFEGQLRAEVGDVSDGSVLFAYVFQPRDHAHLDGMPLTAQHRVETYVGVLDGQPYCLQVRVYPTRAFNSTLARTMTSSLAIRPTTNLLGSCRPYLQHGLPGERVHEWIEAGAATFALEHGESDFDPDLLGLNLDWNARNLFGMSVFSRSDRPIEADRCESGYADACAELVLRPVGMRAGYERERRIIRESPVTALGSATYLGSFFIDEEYIFSDLERDFGSDAFGNFWRSEADVSTAFEASFGVPLGEWMVDWIDRGVGVDSAGPGLPRSASTGGTLAIALLLGITWLRNRKRQVV